MNETERVHDEKSRLALGGVLAIFVFFLTELVFIGRYDNGFLGDWYRQFVLAR